VFIGHLTVRCGEDEIWQRELSQLMDSSAGTGTSVAHRDSGVCCPFKYRPTARTLRECLLTVTVVLWGCLCPNSCVSGLNAMFLKILIKSWKKSSPGNSLLLKKISQILQTSELESMKFKIV
jgi:hypothetical protein